VNAKESAEMIRSVRDSLRTLMNVLGRSAARGDAENDDNDDDIAKVREADHHLNELFAICVAGEFNSGKSSLINALAGSPGLLRSGVTPTTDTVHAVVGGSLDRSDDDLRLPSFVHSAEVRLVPAATIPWLRGGVLFDTPGTNAIVKDHERITQSIIPRCDLVLFVTSADRPFTESERIFLSMIRSWRKSVVVVVNKIDILECAEAIDEVTAYVSAAARETLGVHPPVFAVSEKDVSDLHTFIKDTLTTEEHVRMKVEAVSGVALKVAEKRMSTCRARERDASRRLESIESLDRQHDLFLEEVRKDMGAQLERVDGALRDVCDRADDFFEEQLQLTNIFALTSGIETMKNKFEVEVVKDSAARVDRATNELVQWIVHKIQRQSEWSVRFLTAASLAVPESDESDDSLVNRDKLLSEASDVAAQEIAELVPGNAKTSSEYVRKVSNSVLTSTATIAFGGATISGLVAASMLDWSGLVGSISIILGGVVVLPMQRHAVKSKFRKQMHSMRSNVRRVLTEHGEGILDTSVDKMRSSVGPYRRMLDTQRENVTREMDDLKQIQARVGSIFVERDCSSSRRGGSVEGA